MLTEGVTADRLPTESPLFPIGVTSDSVIGSIGNGVLDRTMFYSDYILYI